MEKELFRFEWLNSMTCKFDNGDYKKPIVEFTNKEDIYDTCDYICTSCYDGYIISYIDESTGERLTFNCASIDIEKEYIEGTTKSMLDRFTITSNGVNFYRKDPMKLVSIHVPRKLYTTIIKSCLDNLKANNEVDESTIKEIKKYYKQIYDIKL